MINKFVAIFAIGMELLSTVEPEHIIIEEPAAVIEEIKVEYATYLSEEIQGYCVDFGEAYDIPPELLMAQIERESSGRTDAVSSCGALGLMQVMPKWHADRMEQLGVTDLFDAEQNIFTGSDYMRELFDRFGSWEIALTAYNEGPSSVNVKNENPNAYATWIIVRMGEICQR